MFLQLNRFYLGLSHITILHLIIAPNNIKGIKTGQAVLNHMLPLPSRRKDQKIINKLRLGHMKITHNYLMQKLEPPICDDFQEELTAEHVILNNIKQETKLKSNTSAVYLLFLSIKL